MDIQSIVNDLKRERERLDRAIAALEGPGAARAAAAGPQAASVAILPARAGI